MFEAKALQPGDNLLHATAVQLVAIRNEQVIVERCDGGGAAVETPIGLMPTADAIDRTGLQGVDAADMAELLAVDRPAWRAELALVREHYARFGAHLPPELGAQLAALEARLSA